MMCRYKKSLIILSLFCITYTNFISSASDSLNFHQVLIFHIDENPLCIYFTEKKGRSTSENLSYGNNQLTDKRGIAREYYYI